MSDEGQSVSEMPRRSGGGFWVVGSAILLAALATVVLYPRPSSPARADEAHTASPHVAGDSIAAGRYLVQVAGCNDCHTPGFMQDPNVPEEQWLTGSSLGFNGPWGTSYASNLRLLADIFTEDQWAGMMKERSGLPPMPWPSLHAMSDADHRSMYRYLKHLGPAGEPAPGPLPPGQTPQTPYLNFLPVLPAAQ